MSDAVPAAAGGDRARGWAGALSRWWGLLGIAFYAIHAGNHLAHGHPADVCWACHVGALLVGVGLLARAPRVNGIGFLWLVIGNGCWALELAAGGEFVVTSLLTHVGGLALGVAGLRAYGMPAGAWWQAMAAFVLLQLVTRATTAPAANVNVAFRVWTGWERRFPSYPPYLVMLWAGGLATCFVVAALARRLLGRRG